MEHYAAYMTGYGHQGSCTCGHSVNGERIRGSARVPLDRWVWLSTSGQSWRNMSPAEAKAHAAEYGERSRGGMTKIALMRMGRGLTQADVAARMHVSPQTYADIERGRKGVKVATLQRVAQALEVPTADLID